MNISSSSCSSFNRLLFGLRPGTRVIDTHSLGYTFWRKIRRTSWFEDLYFVMEGLELVGDWIEKSRLMFVGTSERLTWLICSCKRCDSRFFRFLYILIKASEWSYLFLKLFQIFNDFRIDRSIEYSRWFWKWMVSPEYCKECLKKPRIIYFCKFYRD